MEKIYNIIVNELNNPFLVICRIHTLDDQNYDVKKDVYNGIIAEEIILEKDLKPGVNLLSKRVYSLNMAFLSSLKNVYLYVEDCHGDQLLYC